MKNISKTKSAVNSVENQNKLKPISVKQDPPNDIINKLVVLYKEGNLLEVIKITRNLTLKYPNSFVIWNLLGAASNGLGLNDEANVAFKKVTEISPTYPDGFNNLGVTLQNKGSLDHAIQAFKVAIELKPNYTEAHTNYGNCQRQQGNLTEALKAYKKALSSNPEHAETYTNIGILLTKRGEVNEALEAFKKSLSLKPTDFSTFNNMGNALQEQSNFKEAEQAYRQAIRIKPNYAEGYNNLGASLDNQNMQEEAISNYEKAISLKPNYYAAYMNMITLLSYHKPLNTNKNHITKADAKLRSVSLKHNNSNVISDNHILKVLLQTSSIITTSGSIPASNQSQVYRRNAKDLNCKRHSSIFKNHNIIPKFCFGCYKVQIEPSSILELIKLYIIFDELELEENNIRKCMIELRPQVAGFYKGLIFCSSLDQATGMSILINSKIQNFIGKTLTVKVKRGCSEYPISFPEYGEIDKSKTHMVYNKDWEKIETDYDQARGQIKKNNTIKSLNGLNLNDALIIQNWISYAKGIGDTTVKLIDDSHEGSPTIFEIAKGRVPLTP